jgi:hypothetical protein
LLRQLSKSVYKITSLFKRCRTKREHRPSGLLGAFYRKITGLYYAISRLFRRIDSIGRFQEKLDSGKGMRQRIMDISRQPISLVKHGAATGLFFRSRREVRSSDRDSQINNERDAVMYAADCQPVIRRIEKIVPAAKAEKRCQNCRTKTKSERTGNDYRQVK